MARFHDAAGRGASRTLRAAYVEPEPLTGAELDALLDAMLRADALEAYRQTWTRGER